MEEFLMSLRNFEAGCHGCKRSQNLDGCLGGIIEFQGDWILNHYQDQQSFLGWLALQPKYHRMDFCELTPIEASSLGINIKNIQIALREYWETYFLRDPIKRIYIVYFFESEFDLPKPTDFHLHIHLIPRTEEMDRLLREQVKDGSTINAWKIHCINRSGQPPYPIDRVTVGNLMNFLRDKLE
jgi:hypothetical protein